MTYAEIQDGVCVNTVVADELFARVMGLVELPDGYGVGDFYRDGIWSCDPPTENTFEEQFTAAVEKGLSV